MHQISAKDDSIRPDLAVLDQIQRRVLWLAVRMVDFANRRGETEIKVGGHQASSASMVSLMTALWFGHIGGDDKVAVKPHASPVYHAIKYLTGELNRSHLTRLRAKSGLQAYPSRTKDPDVADFSTGSVGLGAVAPLFSAATRRYVEAHFGKKTSARFIAIAGDAELDEGNVWEAIVDPALSGLGNVMLVIDLNRQSLDRVVPGIQARRLERFFADAGWHVVEAKYGRRLQAAFQRPGGEALRRHIDEMSNEEYQSSFAYEGDELRQRFIANADPDVKQFLEDIADDDLAPLIHNLGGHDLDLLLECFKACDEMADRPSVVFAYTIKGWGLPIAGDPLNHAALLSSTQIDELRSQVGLSLDDEWDRFPSESDAGRLCERVGSQINNLPPPTPPTLDIPSVTNAIRSTRLSTQEALGRILVELGRIPEVAARLVTASPDVAISTNLGGWINSQGVFSPSEKRQFSKQDSLLRWTPTPSGHHIELGISEMNLFMLLGQLGLAHEHHGEMLLPVGTVYDPFVLRGLDALIYSLYNGGRFIVVGTPSGISLAPEGGAHQSTITPSVGLELPGVVAFEPTYGKALDWILCDSLRNLSGNDGESAYLRCSTRPIDQTPFQTAAERYGEHELRRAVLAGGYRLREPGEGEPVILTASGAIMPEVITAAELLEEEGVAATVIDITSHDLLFRGWKHPLDSQAAQAIRTTATGHLNHLIPASERAAPIITVHDASPHTMAWLGSVFGQRVIPIGVDRFGESGSIPDLYETFGLLPEQIVNSTLVGLDTAT